MLTREIVGKISTQERYKRQLTYLMWLRSLPTPQSYKKYFITQLTILQRQI